MIALSAIPMQHHEAGQQRDAYVLSRSIVGEEVSLTVGGARMPCRKRRIGLRVLFVAVALAACQGARTPEEITATLRVAETYELELATGDEDGARVLEQAQHFAVSEIRRDASTHWSARYVYEPAADFVGEDRVLLAVLSGSDGASAPTLRRRISVRFVIRE